MLLGGYSAGRSRSGPRLASAPDRGADRPFRISCRAARDGQAQGGGGEDTFPIKIWDKGSGGAIVYDNELGASDDADATTALGSGSIRIHGG